MRNFLTAFIPPVLGLSGSWELVEAASQLGWVRGAPVKPVTEGTLWRHPPIPTIQVRTVSKGNVPETKPRLEQ